MPRADLTRRHQQLEAARSGFERLLEKHLLAFADHGAEFYAGSGSDPSARTGTRANQSRRIAQHSVHFSKAHAIALEAGETDTATELLARATKRWEIHAIFPIFAVCKRLLETRERSSQHDVDRRVFVAGAAITAFSPALRLLRQMLLVPELKAVLPPVFMISGWSTEADSSPGDEIWMRVGHGWRTAWR